MNYNFGPLFLTHYELYLGAPVNREVFEGPGLERSVQILSFERVFPGCIVFGSFGLTHFASELGGPVEVVLPVDTNLESVPQALANALFFAVSRRMSLGRGISITGLASVCPKLANAFGKEAIYLTLPFGFPDEFATVRLDGVAGRILMAMFISKSEHEFFMDHGCDEFERLLERKNVDPFHLGRPSVVN